MFFIITALLVFAPTINCIANDLPDYFPRCYIDDPNINKCLLDAFNEVRPYVKKGVEELGILRFYPLVLPIFHGSQETAEANFTFTGWDFTVWGLQDYDVKQISYDPKTLVFSTTMDFGHFPSITDYEISGHIIQIPIEGKGEAYAKLEPTNATIVIKGELIDVKGVEYYNTLDVDVTIHFEDTVLYFEGLFDGDEELGRLTNQQLNDRSVEVVKATTPFFEQACREQIMGYIKMFTSAIPYNKIFPKSNN